MRKDASELFASERPKKGHPSSDGLLIVMASNLSSDGLQPKIDGLHPSSDGLLIVMASNLRSMASTLVVMAS